MKTLTLKQSHLGYLLTDGAYTNSIYTSNDGNSVLLSSDSLNRDLFTTNDWRKKRSGTLSLTDIEKNILVIGKETRLFILQPQECEFGYRSGKLVYQTIGKKNTIIVEETHEWDE